MRGLYILGGLMRLWPTVSHFCSPRPKLMFPYCGRGSDDGYGRPHPNPHRGPPALRRGGNPPPLGGWVSPPLRGLQTSLPRAMGSHTPSSLLLCASFGAPQGGGGSTSRFEMNRNRPTRSYRALGTHPSPLTHTYPLRSCSTSGPPSPPSSSTGASPSGA